MALRILLDTHVWLWMNGAVGRLPADTREVLADGENELFLSAASVWEIAIKVKTGRLAIPQSPERYIPSRMTRNRVSPLSIHQDHALRAAALPEHHRDPFDRMLIAQALAEDLKLMSADRRLRRYDLDLLWFRSRGE